MSLISRLQQALQTSKSTEVKTTTGVNPETLPAADKKADGVGHQLFQSAAKTIGQIKNALSLNRNTTESKKTADNINHISRDTLHINGSAAAEKASAPSYADKLSKTLNKLVDGKPPEPKNVAELQKQVDKRLDKLINTPGYKPAKVKEEINLLTALQEKIKKNPEGVEKDWKNAKTDLECRSLYSQMGAIRFLGIHAKIEENGKKGSANEMAIMGYTTEDYSTINPAMRKVQGNIDQIKDPSTSSYAKTLHTSLEQLPNIAVQEEGFALKRGMNPPKGAKEDWAEQLFQVGSFFTDSSFTSTSYSDPPGASIIITYVPPKGATEFSHAKLLDSAYSLWPGEKEAIIMPNTPFLVEGLTKDPDTGVISVTLRGIDQDQKADQANWRHAGVWLQDVKRE